MSHTSWPSRFAYPFEEFCDHMRAMKTVREWEYTSRFGQLGKNQTKQANNARVVDYFCDCYQDSAEALRKAEVFLSVCDYFARNSEVFTKRGLVEDEGHGLLSVDPALLRAVHHVFTSAASSLAGDPGTEI